MAVKNQSESFLTGDVDTLSVLSPEPAGICADSMLLGLLRNDAPVLPPLASARSFDERLSSLSVLPPPPATADDSANTIPLAVNRSIRVCRGERKLAGSNGMANVTNDTT